MSVRTALCARRSCDMDIRAVNPRQPAVFDRGTAGVICPITAIRGYVDTTGPPPGPRNDGIRDRSSACNRTSGRIDVASARHRSTGRPVDRSTGLPVRGCANTRSSSAFQTVAWYRRSSSPPDTPRAGRFALTLRLWGAELATHVVAPDADAAGGPVDIHPVLRSWLVLGLHAWCPEANQPLPAEQDVAGASGCRAGPPCETGGASDAGGWLRLSSRAASSGDLA